MEKKLIYIHGKGGSAAEAMHYVPLFPDHDVVGFDYRAETPWEAQVEFAAFIDTFAAGHPSLSIIANSIGAFFAINALSEKAIEKAYFISPIVDMEGLISDMMRQAGVSEGELKEKGTVETPFGQTLSWEYLAWVRAHPISWRTPTDILYGENDNLQSLAAIENFAKKIGAALTVMKGGEHWFHTDEEMDFLDNWVKEHKN